MDAAFIVRDPPRFDVLGPIVEFLTSPGDPTAFYCVMRGTIPPGVHVPLHAHADPETFHVISGSVEMLCEGKGRLECQRASVGDVVHVPGGAKHAFRNASAEPVVQLIVSTPRLGRFFLEVGRQIAPGSLSHPPSPADIERFQRISERYGYWNGSPEENAAVGIRLPIPANA